MKIHELLIATDGRDRNVGVDLPLNCSFILTVILLMSEFCYSHKLVWGGGFIFVREVNIFESLTEILALFFDSTPSEKSFILRMFAPWDF